MVIYDGAEIYLNRKYNEYKKFSSWKRTKKKVNRRTWTKEEDKFILKNTVEESMKKLGRTEKSIRLRRFRLKKIGQQLTKALWHTNRLKKL